MYVTRSLQLGLVVFAATLLVGTIVEKDSDEPAPIPSDAVSVVDVAYGVDASQLSALVRLATDERVIAVDDRPVANDLAAGAAIAERGLGTGKYLDLTVGGARGKRRVLVLMH